MDYEEKIINNVLMFRNRPDGDWHQVSIEKMSQRLMEQKDSLEIKASERHVGTANYSQKKIQPWDIWEEYNLDAWDADIIKRVLRTKEGNLKLDYEKMIHICQKQIERIESGDKT